MMPIEKAILDWQEILGLENVKRDDISIKRAESATFSTTERILVVLRPSTTDEVIGCVKIAHQGRIPVYPVSAARNWGYGSAVPWKDSSALLDLSRMKAISHLDEKLGVMTVEPGVTFQEAYTFLEEKNSGRALTVIGGTPHGSIVGNTLERGIGTGPYGDRALYACNLEVVLPNGEVIRTGVGRFKDAQVADLARWGTGPCLDGLFFQSNFGIVTKMTVYLPRKPALFGAFRLALKDERRFPELIDRLQELRSRGLLGANVTIMSDIRMFASYGQYPWVQSGGITPLPGMLREEMRRSQSVGSWNVTSALFANDAISLSAMQRQVKKTLGHLCSHLLFVNERVERYRSLLRPLWKFRWGVDLDKYLDASYRRSVYRGVPNSISMMQAYWRKKALPPKDMNPDRDRCGCIWVCPELPFTGTAASEVAKILTTKFVEFGFDPLISFVGLSEQTLRAVAAIMYDRDVPGEDELAMRCYHDTIRALQEAGFYPYRLGVQSADYPRSDDPAYESVVSRLKQALDPNQILSPGHYVSPVKPRSPSKVTIRHLEPDELDRVVQLRHSVWLHKLDGSDANIPDWLTRDRFDATSTHWGVFSGDELIGAARASLIPSANVLRQHEMYQNLTDDLPFPLSIIERLVISPDAREMGLALRLDAIRIAYSARMGARAVIGAFPPYRIKGLQTLGFETIKLTKDGFDNTTLAPPTIMRLDLRRLDTASAAEIQPEEVIALS